MEIKAIQKQFPALSLQDEGKRRIYLDNPAGTQVPASVIAAISDCLHYANANLGGPFSSSVAADAIVAQAHQAMADLLHASDPDEIIFGPNMTTLTFQLSRALGRTFEAGDEIIVSELDHDANVSPWVLMARDHGLRVRKIRLDTRTYRLDYEHFDSLLGPKTRMVCVGHASNLLGTINDIGRIVGAAHRHNALVFVDAVHSAPHVVVDVQAMGCDLLACSPYKFFGPHQGVLWGKKSLLDSLPAYKLVPVPDTLPGRFETGTQNHEAMAGVTAAVDYLAGLGADNGTRRERLESAMRRIQEYEQSLCQYLLERLAEIRGLQIHGITDHDALADRSPTVSFTMAGVAPKEIAHILAEDNIFAWSGHSYAVEPCQALGLMESGGVLRVGLVHYNTRDDIDALIGVLGRISEQQQNRRTA